LHTYSFPFCYSYS
jgi:hypothetical protein